MKAVRNVFCDAKIDELMNGTGVPFYKFAQPFWIVKLMSSFTQVDNRAESLLMFKKEEELVVDVVGAEHKCVRWHVRGLLL